MFDNLTSDSLNFIVHLVQLEYTALKITEKIPQFQFFIWVIIYLIIF